jgi:prevent-host-death family protein
VTDYITISELRKAPTRLLRSVSVGKKEYIVTSNGLPIFTIIKTKCEASQQIGINTMRQSLSDFYDLLEEYGAVTLTAHGKPLVRCMKL